MVLFARRTLLTENGGMEEKPVEIPRRFTFGWLIAGTLIGFVLWIPTFGHGWFIEIVVPLRGAGYGLIAGLWIDLFWNSQLVLYRWPKWREIAVMLAVSLAILGSGRLLEALILMWARQGFPYFHP